MNRFLVLTVALVGWCAGESVSAAEKPLNVLFLIADDLNCDLNCYGHEEIHSPNIDAFAKSGVRFEHAYCQYPLCSPSRSSFLTGLRPNRSGVLRNPGRLSNAEPYGGTPHFREANPEHTPLPQLFKKNGYQVTRVGKLYHYGVPGHIGTSSLDDPPSWNRVVNPAGRDKAEEHLIFSMTPGQFGGSLSWLKSKGTDYEQTDGLSATAAISLLQQHARNRDRPFFLAVGFFRPHTPYVSPEKYFDLYPIDSVRLPELSEDDQAEEPKAAYLSQKPEQRKMTDDLRKQAIQAYHASISFMDAQVGRVVKALEEVGLADNTVVLMTSDHGYHMYEHGLFQKMSLFENAARVPLIIRLPGAQGNGQTAVTMAELVDLYPTLADLCGLKLLDELDGVSLRPALEDPSQLVKEEAFSQITVHARRGPRDRQGYSIRTPRWRYTAWAGGEAGEQLFDMQADPRETKNLAGNPELAGVVAELKARLADYSANEPPAE